MRRQTALVGLVLLMAVVYVADLAIRLTYSSSRVQQTFDDGIRAVSAPCDCAAAVVAARTDATQLETERMTVLLDEAERRHAQDLADLASANTPPAAPCQSDLRLHPLAKINETLVVERAMPRYRKLPQNVLDAMATYVRATLADGVALKRQPDANPMMAIPPLGLPGEADSWDDVNVDMPNRAEAHAKLLRAAESLKSMNLSTLPSLPVHVEIGGIRLGPDYMGNTRGFLRMLQFEGTDYIVKLEAPTHRTFSHHSYIYGMDLLVAECGFGAMFPVQAPLDVQGLRGMIATRLDGITLDKYRHSKTLQWVQSLELTRQLFRELPHWQVRLLALYDVLFAYADRHTGNVWITPTMELRGIDSVQLTFSVAPFVDSIFIPITRRFAMMRFSQLYMFRTAPRIHEIDDANLLFDYRCHTIGGAIKYDYPPKLAACMRKFANASPAALMDEYQLPPPAAQWLHNTSDLLLTKGFEQAMWLLARDSAAKMRQPNKNANDLDAFYMRPMPCCLQIHGRCVAVPAEYAIPPN
eukprot:c21800_g1_i1.p1 GENE.c21800_g1_i1~~c21800_g1_i1.p1  ORF type:complete len:526 (+),score=108.40 c21800_g1_i1:145-1722(+)